MAHALEKLIVERIKAGLQRRSLVTCSRWAEACRVMAGGFPGPWRFKNHPWLREMHDSTAELNVGQKSAQMGYTEWALNTAFFSIDVKSRDVLYVLPAKTPDASDFSAARFDPALELSEHLTKLFSDVKNVGHKRAGTTNLYIRGSKSRAGLKSIPVGLIILDEVDEMDQDNIPLAMERAAGQREKQTLMISTPTVAGFGINKYFSDSTQEHFFFRCPACSKMTELIFPDCLEVTAENLTDPTLRNSYIKCKECKCRIEHAEKPEIFKTGESVPTFKGRSIRGFQVNQMYSTVLKPVEIAQSFLRSLKDPADEQEFYNSKLGLPHIVAGAAVTMEQIDQCRELGRYKNGTFAQGIITMGIDVGRKLHVEIDHWMMPKNRYSQDLNIEATPRVMWQGTLDHFEQLDKLMFEWRVNGCVIDAHPERRKAYEFASRFWGYVKLCIYARGIVGKQIHVLKDQTGQEIDEHTITVDRTAWLDLALARFKRRGIHLPVDIDMEYKQHICNIVRVYEKDKDGNPVGRYVTASGEDHYAHARNYAEMALLFATGVAPNVNIKGAF